MWPKRRKTEMLQPICVDFHLNKRCPIHRCVRRDGQDINLYFTTPLSVDVVLEKRLMGGNDGEIYKTTTACAHETGIEIVKVREKDVEGRCYQEAYMHAFLWCRKNFAPELLLVGESEHNIYICMKRMEKTLCDWIPTRKVGMIADVLIKFFQTLDSLHKEYGFVLGTIQRNKTTVATHWLSCGASPYAPVQSLDVFHRHFSLILPQHR